MSSTLVTYYIQGELGESLEIPNGFMINIPNSTQFSFGQFLKEFPLPNSNDFHFRFRMDDKHCDYSWLDVKNSHEVLPRYRNTISVKLLRLGDAVAMQRRSSLKLKASVTTTTPSPTAPSSSRSGPFSAPQPQSQHASSPFSDSNDASGGRGVELDGFAASPPDAVAPVDMFMDSTPPASTPAPVAVAPAIQFKTVNPYIATDDDIDDEPPVATGSGSSEPPDLFNMDMDAMSDPKANNGDANGANTNTSAALEAKRGLDAKKRQDDEDLDQSRLKLETMVTVS